MGSWILARYRGLSPLAQRISLAFASSIVLVSLFSFSVPRGDAAARRLGVRAHATLAPTRVMALAPNEPLERLVADSILGYSGKLRGRFLLGPLSQSYPSLDNAVGAWPGVNTVALSRGGGTFSFISMVPFSRKSADHVGEYLVGFWPAEVRFVNNEEYDNPVGFIEVTRENQDTRVSEHFVLRDFITRDHQSVWPKYLVLQEALLDKLELVLADLHEQGFQVHNVRVLSGFRTPFHNQRGLGSEGGARDSRHQFGDAADIIIDVDRNGRMDDLNRDGRVDTRDLDIILQAVERVERAHPDLIGGLGGYQAMGPSGPFAHIDVRGYRARWNNATRPTVASGKGAQPVPRVTVPGEPVRLNKCSASPEFAALCGKGPSH